jgi:glycosyltransferase involved in cell wall biosynthesis
VRSWGGMVRTNKKVWWIAPRPSSGPRESPRNVAQVLLSKRVGGAETLAASLQKSWSELRIAGEIVYLDSTEDSSSSPLRRLLRLSRRLAQAKADVIVAHSALPALYARACAPLGTPVFVVLHSATDDFEDWKLRLSERVVRWRTRGIVAVSASQAETYLRRFGDRVGVSVIPNGIDEAFVANADGPRAEPRLVVEVARLVPQKNPELWLTAALRARTTNPELSFEWWGPALGHAPLAEELNQLARKGGIASPFLGGTAEPKSVYERADILLHTASREAHSVGLLEAAAMGLVIVCSEEVSRTLPAQIHVTTFSTEDPEGPYAALQQVVANWPDLAERADRGAVWVRENFSAESCAVQYLGLFAQTRGGYPGPH